MIWRITELQARAEAAFKKLDEFLPDPVLTDDYNRHVDDYKDPFWTKFDTNLDVSESRRRAAASRARDEAFIEQERQRAMLAREETNG